MNSFHLNRFLFDLKMNEPTLEQARENLDKVMEQYDLTVEEKDALRAIDPKRLSRLGAHGMLAIWIMQLDPDFVTNTYWSQK